MFLRLSEYTTIEWAKNNRGEAEDHWPVDCIAYTPWNYSKDTNEYEMVYYSYMKKRKNGTIYRELAWTKPD